MRAALVVVSLLATAAAQPHLPIHKRHGVILQRQNGTVDEEGPSSVVSTTDVTSSTTSEKATSTSTTTTAVIPTSETTTKSTTQNVEPTTSSTTESAAPTSSVVDTTSTAQSSTSSPVESSASSTPSSSASDTAPVAPTSQSTSDSASGTTSRSALPTKGPSVVTTGHTKTSITTASSTAAPAGNENKSSGLPKPALIAIIVVACVVGVAAIVWTLFRKWKLRPSNRFDARMQPIDFTPNNGMGDDDFLEKTLQRSASVTSADRQRQQFVADLEKDNSLTAGIPEHDFTAGHSQAAYNQYDPDPYEYDPYARAQPYDFSQPRTDQEVDYPAMPEPTHNTYPPTATTPPAGTYYPDYPTQDHHSDETYSPVQRGPSINHYPPKVVDPLAMSDFSVGGRPSAGRDSPYAQAAAFRY